MNVGVLGAGDVAKVLGAGFRRHGHEVMLGSRSPEKLGAWAEKHGAKAGTFAEAAAFGALIVLAVKGSAAVSALELAGAEHVDGKVVIDTTNPIAETAPVQGVLRFFTDLNESLMEQIQAAFPAARLVKAFNSVGNACMVNPKFAGGPPTMFVCGNDPDAKGVVSGVLEQFGWEVADMGHVEAARAIEPLCMLWCIPGFLRNDWAHAFKLIK